MHIWPPKVRDYMTNDPVWSSPEASIETVARQMASRNCGEIPICDEDGKVLGVITDRDITLRVVAAGVNPTSITARTVMTAPAVTVREENSLQKTMFLMEEKNVRRLPVVNDAGTLVGMISQVDIAARASEKQAGHLLAREGARLARPA